ncbi:MAG: Mut7-C RNAse domain-containing protein [Candidatus Competibacteraceae bacterium]|nr:Mut7-C RNAse domain-containing protein [Candidatus Competibacteraceae bacterium]
MDTGTCFLRFYAELNDFLPPERRQVDFPHAFQRHASIKDLIEALGVPHPEIDLILVDGMSVDFAYRARDGDRISVYPMFEAFDIQAVSRVRPEPLRVSQFVLDVHLGKLARYLRLLGFDTLYRNDYADAELARVASAERRILLTRDRALLKRAVVTHGHYVRAADPRRQVEEVVARLDLYRANPAVLPSAASAATAGWRRWSQASESGNGLPPRNPSLYRSVLEACGTCGQVYLGGQPLSGAPPVRRELASPRRRRHSARWPPGSVAEHDQPVNRVARAQTR